MKDDRPFMYNSTMRVPRERLKPVSAKRAKEMRQNRGVETYRDYVRAQYDCAVRGRAGHQCWGTIDPHHVVFQSQGGEDEQNLLPLCRRAHDELHALGSHRLFDAKYGIDSKMLALVYWERSPWGPGTV